MLPITPQIAILIAAFVAVFVCVCIFVLTFVAISLRFALYKHLVYLEKRVRRLVNRDERGEQPEILEQLERRFKEASKNLDQVNTSALIDQVYSQERIGKLSCEQIDNFCRIIPNLLLAFGLLGTFLGITVNLTALSRTISQANASDVNSLVQQLQVPLQGMGIAFITSVIALGFSAFLTLFNLTKNTQLAKYKLISTLEDYLDNIYLPTLNGETRLDKVVKGMSDSFTGFLTRFGQTVREAVESSLKDKIQEIFDANIRATKLAEEVYSRFLDASGTLERAAGIFRDAAEDIEKSDFPQKLAAASADLSHLSQSSSTLDQTIEILKVSISDLGGSIDQLLKLGDKINLQLETSTEVLILTQSNQDKLSIIIPQLEKGAQIIQSSVESINELQNKVDHKTEGLGNIESELNQIAQSLNSYTENVTLQLKAIADSGGNQSEQFQAISNQVEQCASSLYQLTENIKNLQPSASANYSSSFSQQSAYNRNPSNHVGEYQQALNLYQQGKYSAAALIVDRLIRTSPQDEKIRKLRGDIYLKLNQLDTARQEYQALLNMTSNPQVRDYANQGLAYINRRSNLQV